MIQAERELATTLERIRHLQDQVAELRRKETDPENYRQAASGYLAEIDRMQLDVREFLSLHPAEVEARG